MRALCSIFISQLVRPDRVNQQCGGALESIATRYQDRPFNILFENSFVGKSCFKLAAVLFWPCVHGHLEIKVGMIVAMFLL